MRICVCVFVPLLPSLVRLGIFTEAANVSIFLRMCPFLHSSSSSSHLRWLAVISVVEAIRYDVRWNVVPHWRNGLLAWREEGLSFKGGWGADDKWNVRVIRIFMAFVTNHGFYFKMVSEPESQDQMLRHRVELKDYRRFHSKIQTGFNNYNFSQSWLTSDERLGSYLPIGFWAPYYCFKVFLLFLRIKGID